MKKIIQNAVLQSVIIVMIVIILLNLVFRIISFVFWGSFAFDPENGLYMFLCLFVSIAVLVYHFDETKR